MFTFIQELSQETFCHQPQLGDFNARGRRSSELNKNENVLPDLCIKADIFIILTKRNKCWLNEWNPPHLHSCYDHHILWQAKCAKKCLTRRLTYLSPSSQILHGQKFFFEFFLKFLVVQVSLMHFPVLIQKLDC